MTYLVDAPSPASDRLHHTGDVVLGGLIDVNLGFTPQVWNHWHTGDYILPLSAVGALTGEVAASLPSIETLPLPTPPPQRFYQWHTVYDRDDMTPDPALEDLSPGLQPWIGNGTKDVIFLIVEVGYEPIADPDGYVIYEGDVLNVAPPGVLHDDFYADAAALVPNTGPGHGTLSFRSNGSFTYTPNVGFYGSDSFQYVALHSLTNQQSDPAVVTIDVISYEPIAAPDGYSFYAAQGSLSVSAPGVLANDSFAVEAELVPGTGPYHGSLTFNADGSFVYTPTAGYYGPDTFQYIATKPITQQESSPATVTLTVMSYDPVANPDGYSMYAGMTINGNVLGNDSYADAAQLAGPGPSFGSFSFNADGSFSFTAPSGSSGTATFQYIALNTATGQQSDPATVTITVINFGPPLMLAQPAIDSEEPALGMQSLVMLGQEAIGRWRRAGVNEETLDVQLSSLQFLILDLPGSMLGTALDDGTIVVDINAGGHGWFIDPTPWDDGEFSIWTSRSERRAVRGSEAAGRVDLLTVLEHEIGHLLGLDHAEEGSSDGSIMEHTLDLGTRRFPTAMDAAAADYLFSIWQAERRLAG